MIGTDFQHDLKLKKIILAPPTTTYQHDINITQRIFANTQN